MNVLPTPHSLVNRADSALRKLDAAERSGDALEIAEARREGERVRKELTEHVRDDRSLGLFKAAQAAPKSLFSASPGAALASFPQSSNFAQPSGGWPYSEEERAAMAMSGEAMKNGAFPIKNATDVERAIANFKTPGPHQTTEAKKHILRRATELGALHLIPDDWRGDTQASGSKAAPAFLRK